MLPLVSVLTQFLIVVLVVTAALLGTAVGYYYVRARRAQNASLLSASERRELQRRDAEIATIRTRIEELYRLQRHGSETQHAFVRQQLEDLQHQLQARAHQIEGLQSQLRHEIRVREATMQELRRQLAEGLRGLHAAAAGAPTAAALPPAAQATSPETEPLAAVEPLPVGETLSVDELLPATPSAGEEAPAGAGWSWEPIELDFDETLATPAPQPDEPAQADADEHAAERLTAAAVRPAAETGVPVAYPKPSASSGDLPASDLLALFDVPPPTPASADAEPEFVPLAAWLDEPDETSAQQDDDPFAGLVQWAPLPERAATPYAAAPSGDGAARLPAETPHGAQSVAAEAPPARPDGAEDLTVLPMIDAERQAVLYGLGVHTIEDIARWGRADARRVAAAFRSVSEDTILNEWVFAAQSVLFDRYQAELEARRARSLAQVG